MKKQQSTPEQSQVSQERQDRDFVIGNIDFTIKNALSSMELDLFCKIRGLNSGEDIIGYHMLMDSIHEAQKAPTLLDKQREIDALKDELEQCKASLISQSIRLIQAKLDKC